MAIDINAPRIKPSDEGRAQAHAAALLKGHALLRQLLTPTKACEQASLQPTSTRHAAAEARHRSIAF